MFDARYDDDPIAREAVARTSGPRMLDCTIGAELEELTTGFFGRVVSFDKQTITLRDFDGAQKTFLLSSAFADDEGLVQLRLPMSAASQGGAPKTVARSASGSRIVENLRARVAREGRIFVEGKHDAELVEKVWGHDLRVEGVVVELLEGADHLAEVTKRFAPSPSRRMGVLLDHLVAGSKETAIATEARKVGGDNLLVLGHPFVDIWQAVHANRVGLEYWPDIPRAESWKHGMLKRLGLPHADNTDVAEGWRKILGRVRGYGDLDAQLLGPVEQLIDFVTAP